MNSPIPNEEQRLPTAFLTDIWSIIDTGRRQAYAAVGQSAIATFWNVGRRIVEDEQNGQGRAAYGTGLIKNLAEQLSPFTEQATASVTLTITGSSISFSRTRRL